MRATWVVCAGVLLLGGCSSLNDWLSADKTDYKSSSTLPRLEVPPDLSTPKGDGRYAVPDGTAPEAATATFSGYEAQQRQAKPQRSGGVLPQVDGMHIERDGSERWLVVDRPPEKLWPLIKDFWLENGFLIAAERPEAGIMETNWAEQHPKFGDGPVHNVLGRVLGSITSTGTRDRFRTRLERTPDGKGTEIYISQQGLEEVYVSETNYLTKNETQWQPRPNDPGLEAEYLRRLMVSLGEQPQQAAEIVQTAMASSGQERARIKKGPSGELLEVDEPFDRTWRRVGLALDRVGFTVEDRDRQKGLYYVRYADPDTSDKRGFLARFFSQHRKLTAEQYRIQISEAGTQSDVNVLDKNGAADSSQTAQRILSLLHEQLK